MWTEHVRARMPVGDEATQLRIPPGAALLVVPGLCRISEGRHGPGRPVFLEETRSRADQIELAYRVL